ncbi:MBL fold metallo-hydrolase [Periweissella cryptocerci]|uniref:MBL fold metallo-hydrolase n=1 Tax=Periweissella cryptocerci TaxID=2506420 RepID=A0A4P6YRI6_9LACO|nr:MBL fold metallo-hydrolase [Periweissella cryptocerci]QBO35269.1 MBL fold metallo-hydrolase [Periweissella cryptocerci]
MKITVLGYYGGYPANGIGTSGFLIESGDYHLLLDAGSGTLLVLEEIMSPLQLDAVLLTHYHADHIADVGVLKHYWQLAPGEKKQPLLPIYGNPADSVNFNSLDWPNSTQKMPYDATSHLQLGPLKLTFLQTKHPVTTFAVRIQEANNPNELVYTADTAVIPELAEFSKGAEVLLADTNFFADKTGERWHLTSTEAGALAKEAQVKRLYLTHLPQTGSLAQLVNEAQISAGSEVKVMNVQRKLEILL